MEISAMLPKTTAMALGGMIIASPPLPMMGPMVMGFR